MDAAERSGHVRYQYPVPAMPRPANGVKIFGLVAVRNVGENVAQFLQLLAKVVDAIAVLDDASTDDTVEQVLRVAEQVRVEALITKRDWLRNEAQDKNLLLRLARRLHGTAFVVPDYDETFSAACVERNYLRSVITTMPPGSRLGLHWKEYWGSLDKHRIDPMQPSQNFLNRMIPIIFIDFDDKVTYVPEKDKPLKIHYPRIPMTGGGVQFADDRRCVIVEFRFVSGAPPPLRRAATFALIVCAHHHSHQCVSEAHLVRVLWSTARQGASGARAHEPAAGRGAGVARRRPRVADRRRASVRRDVCANRSVARAPNLSLAAGVWARAVPRHCDVERRLAAFH